MNLIQIGRRIKEVYLQNPNLINRQMNGWIEVRMNGSENTKWKTTISRDNGAGMEGNKSQQISFNRSIPIEWKQKS